MIPQIEKNELYAFGMDVDNAIHPIEFFRQFANTEHTLLLMSAEVESKQKQKSMVIIKSSVKITCDKDKFLFSALNDNGKNFIIGIAPILEQEFDCSISEEAISIGLTKTQSHSNQDEDERLRSQGPFSPIRKILEVISCHKGEDFFLAGNMNFDLIETFEDLPAVEKGLTSCPYFSLYLSELALEINHETGRARLNACIFGGDNYEKTYYDLSRRMQEIKKESSSAHTSKNEIVDNPGNLSVSLSIEDKDFMEKVKEIKGRIVDGDIFQAVLSRVFIVDAPNPLASFERLTQLNPSPYMFYMKDRDFELFGASPESALKYNKASREVIMYPIAGTRRRGIDSKNELDLDQDGKIEIELRSNIKEVAEHMMLVDLARNDIAKISETGSRYVAPLMKVDRYERVMHLVSQVQGTLKADLDALHAYQATMNMGTLTGAPKISAMNIIRKLEGCERGTYGGAVGYINGNGDMDTCIVIRSAFVKNNKAYVQAGAGIVHDSDLHDETQETKDKAFSVLKALGVKGLL